MSFCGGGTAPIRTSRWSSTRVRGVELGRSPIDTGRPVPNQRRKSPIPAIPSTPRSRSIAESASAIVQNGARPSQDAVRQKVWRVARLGQHTR
jgi:hypothetical protein